MNVINNHDETSTWINKSEIFQGDDASLGSSVGEKMSGLCEESTYHSCESQVDTRNSFVTKSFTKAVKLNFIWKSM